MTDDKKSQAQVDEETATLKEIADKVEREREQGANEFVVPSDDQVDADDQDDQDGQDDQGGEGGPRPDPTDVPSPPVAPGR